MTSESAATAVWAVSTRSTRTAPRLEILIAPGEPGRGEGQIHVARIGHQVEHQRLGDEEGCIDGEADAIRIVGHPGPGIDLLHRFGEPLQVGERPAWCDVDIGGGER